MKNELIVAIIALLIIVMLLSIFSMVFTVCVGRDVAKLKETVDILVNSETERYNDLDKRILQLEEAMK